MKKGFSLVEILVAISIFGIFVVLFFNFFEINRNSYQTVSKKEKAVFLAKEGIEATRYIKSLDFNNLSNGTYGISSSTGFWEFSGSSDQAEGFTREIIISNGGDPDVKKIESKITFDVLGSSKTESLITYLSNWQQDFPFSTCTNQANFLSIATSSYTLSNKNAFLENILLTNTETTCDIVISSISFTHSPPNPSRKLQEIFINGLSVWIGDLISGGTADITDTVIPLSTTYDIDFLFQASVSGKTLSITFTMSDGTTKTLSGFAP